MTAAGHQVHETDLIYLAQVQAARAARAKLKAITHRASGFSIFLPPKKTNLKTTCCGGLAT
jgi:hypothetical protein